MKKVLSFFFSAILAGNMLFAAHTSAPSHELWNELLGKYVSASGKVNYKGFKADKAKLESYLKLLSENAPAADWSKNEKMAFWINAYNAFTIKLIVDKYPLKSIRDLDKPWDTKFIKIGNTSYSLNEIEHTILRKQYFDPRIHFAVNCASKSCPEILNRAFTADKLNAQLESLTKKYINNTFHNSLSADKVEISSLFDWYKEDFTKTGTVIDFINKYAANPVKATAAISYKNYDWNLNE